MRTRIASALLAAVLAMGPLVARADDADGSNDGDAESRFHKAYETEVVDGKLADAARVYLALMSDAAAPARIRAEAKFRFAVTAVLLGRPDEARAHLDAIVADATLTEALRTRARGYLDATNGVGVGTELDRKLQELVFELGRAPTSGPESGQPAVFRDFEVIGKPAVPFLRGLLAHPDGAIRMHAYRLLIRMDVPGMAGAWTPNLTTPSYPMVGSELTAYLRKHAEEAAAFERRMQDADAATLQALVASRVEAPVSVALLRGAKSRGVDAKTLTDLTWISRDRDGVAHVAIEWLRDADRVVASGAAMNLAKMLNRGPIAELDAEPVLPALATAMVRSARPLSWNATEWSRGARSSGNLESTLFYGFMSVARACPVAALVATLGEIVQSPPAETDDKIAPMNRSYVADALAVAIDERRPEGDLRRRYADALCRWTESLSAEMRAQGAFESPLTVHLRAALAALPADDALAVIRRLWDAPARSPHWFAYTALSRSTVQDWDLTMALFRLAEPKDRSRVVAFSDNAARGPDPVPLTAARASAILASLPEIVRISEADKPDGPWERPEVSVLFRACAPLVPIEEAREALVATAGALLDGPDAKGASGRVGAIVNRGNEQDKPFWRDVFLPVADRFWPRLSPSDRSGFVAYATTMLDVPGAAAFVAAHADEISSRDAVQRLARANEFVPFDSWVPRARPSVLDNKEISTNSSPDARAHALAKMAPDPAEANASVRAFARQCAEADARAFYDAVLRTAPLDRMQEAILELDGRNGAPAGLEALEDALARLLTVERPVSFALRYLVEPLVARRPSERIFPGVRRLLASPERGDVTSGIAAAQSLGSAALLPALTDKLESMDAEVRQAAQAAIDSIVELGKRKEEARRRAANGGGGERR